MSDDDTVNVIRPPNTISAKVTKGGPGAVDLAAIERAESIIASMADNYLEWVNEDLVRISDAQEELKANQDNPKDYLEKIFQVAHDMKGQGGSFGYDLMTILGNDLCRFIEALDTVSDTDVEVIDLYIATMQIVITKRMSGDGGEEGKKVLAGLSAVVQKITA